MEKINLFLKMSFCSLILIFYRSFYLLGGGTPPFHIVFGRLPDWLNSITFKLLALISVIGSLILFYSLVRFFVESFRFLYKNKR